MMWPYEKKKKKLEKMSPRYQENHFHTHGQTHTATCRGLIKVDYPHLQMYGFVADPSAKVVAAKPHELFSPSLRVKTAGKWAFQDLKG